MEVSIHVVSLKYDGSVKLGGNFQQTQSSFNFLPWELQNHQTKQLITVSDFNSPRSAVGSVRKK